MVRDVRDVVAVPGTARAVVRSAPDIRDPAAGKRDPWRIHRFESLLGAGEWQRFEQDAERGTVTRLQVPVFAEPGVTDPLFPAIQLLQMVNKLTGALPGTPGGCRVMNTTTDPGLAAWTWSPHTPVTLTGAPVVRVTVTLDGTDSELAARLWDVDPAAGKQALITRGICRRTTAAPGGTLQVAFELWPAARALGSGHELKLELTPDDSPTWRADNLPATITLATCR